MSENTDRIHAQLWVEAQQGWYDVVMEVDQTNKLTDIEMQLQGHPSTWQSADNISCIHEYTDVYLAAINWIFFNIK